MDHELDNMRMLSYLSGLLQVLPDVDLEVVLVAIDLPFHVQLLELLNQALFNLGLFTVGATF